MKKFNLLVCEDNRSFVETISNILLKEDTVKNLENCSHTENKDECVLFIKKKAKNTVLCEIRISRDVNWQFSIKSKTAVIASYIGECLLENNTKLIKDFCLEKLDYVNCLIEKLGNLNDIQKIIAPCNERNIRLFLLKLGIPVNNLGFTYMTEGIFYINNEKSILSITKDIYPHIAKIYASSPINVEKNIRDAISSGYKQNQEAFLEELSLKQKPNNNLFLRLVVEKLKNNV